MKMCVRPWAVLFSSFLFKLKLNVNGLDIARKERATDRRIASGERERNGARRKMLVSANRLSAPN